MCQFRLKGYVGQVLDPFAQRLLLIGIPEKAGVVEAGAKDGFVAVDNQTLGIAIGIADRDELRREIAIRRFDREVSLMDAHHGGEHFLRQVEKLCVKLADERRRPFRQVHQRVEQFVIAFIFDGYGANAVAALIA